MQIEKKIVGYAVSSATNSVQEHSNTEDVSTKPLAVDLVQMHEGLSRPSNLTGATYKIKPPEHVSQHSLYITINDFVLNQGTEHEKRYPYEIFINSKSLEQYQWIVALTLVMSAVFRKGGDLGFLVDELESVFDPRGGYWNKGVYVPSIIAEIAEVIRTHLTSIGFLDERKLDDHQAELIAAKKAELAGDGGDANGDEGWKKTATMCGKCHHKTVVFLDGCQTCLTCSDSKCS